VIQLDKPIKVHHSNMDGTHIGNRVRATDGRTDMEGQLLGVRHEENERINSMRSYDPVRIAVSTFLTIGEHELKVAFDSQVIVS